MALCQMGVSGNTDRLCALFCTDADSDLTGVGLQGVREQTKELWSGRRAYNKLRQTKTQSQTMSLQKWFYTHSYALPIAACRFFGSITSLPPLAPPTNSLYKQKSTVFLGITGSILNMSLISAKYVIKFIPRLSQLSQNNTVYPNHGCQRTGH